MSERLPLTRDESLVEEERSTEKGIKSGTIGHESLFDTTGHLSELGDVVVRIANGQGFWPADEGMRQAALKLLDANRTGSLEDDYEVALAENDLRTEEAKSRIAARALTEGNAREVAAQLVESRVGKSDPSNPFLDTNPESGSQYDTSMASKLPEAVNTDLTGEKFGKNQATKTALRQVIGEEPTAVKRLFRKVFGKVQPSRVDRVVKKIDENAIKAGTRAQQAGDDVRAKQKLAAEQAAAVNPFEQ